MNATGRWEFKEPDPAGIGQESRQGPQVYLLHFSRPYKHARHYTGWASDLEARLAEHEHGRGARLLQVITAAGITWKLARTWPGDRKRERELKNMGGASRRCPECGIKPQADHKLHGQKQAMTADPWAAGKQEPQKESGTSPAGARESDDIRITETTGSSRDGGEVATDKRPAEADRAPNAQHAPEPADVTWTRARLREQIQRTASGLVPTAESAGDNGQEAGHRLEAADGQAVPAARSLTTDMTPGEAANLLAVLEDGHQAAWKSTGEVAWQSPDYESRFQAAREVNDAFLDLMGETVQNGMRQPGETVEQFAQRAEHDTTLATSSRADADTAARLIGDPQAPEGRAYEQALSPAAATRVRELREHDPLPEPDRTPGAPHPDPFLAERGWHVNEHGIYSRKPDPDRARQAENEPEAG
jgi:predicted GIY-YIG superfamily endonuclease